MPIDPSKIEDLEKHYIPRPPIIGPDPIPWWRIFEKLDASQIREIAKIHLDHEIEALNVQIRKTEAMKKIITR